MNSKFEFVSKTHFLFKKFKFLAIFSILIKSAKIHSTIYLHSFNTLSKLLILILFRWRKDAFLRRLYYALPHSAMENYLCTYSSYRYIHSFITLSYRFIHSFITLSYRYINPIHLFNNLFIFGSMNNSLLCFLIHLLIHSLNHSLILKKKCLFIVWFRSLFFFHLIHKFIHWWFIQSVSHTIIHPYSIIFVKQN